MIEICLSLLLFFFKCANSHFKYLNINHDFLFSSHKCIIVLAVRGEPSRNFKSLPKIRFYSINMKGTSILICEFMLVFTVRVVLCSLKINYYNLLLFIFSNEIPYYLYKQIKDHGNSSYSKHVRWNITYLQHIFLSLFT